jgi:carbamoyltransferase
MRTEMDVLVLENCVLVKTRQKPWVEGRDWRAEFSLD